MIRRPPRSTLFPYPPLSRSLDKRLSQRRHFRDPAVQPHRRIDAVRQQIARDPAARSEEHTSELQSQSNLVCRLLLEKKNKHTTSFHLLSCTPLITTTSLLSI